MEKAKQSLMGLVNNDPLVKKFAVKKENKIEVEENAQDGRDEYESDDQ